MRSPGVTEHGASLAGARTRKERRYPEFVGADGRGRLVVFGGEVGGRFFFFFDETHHFFSESPWHVRVASRTSSRGVDAGGGVPCLGLVPVGPCPAGVDGPTPCDP